MILKEQYGKQEKLILPNSLFVVIWSVFFSLAIIIYFGSAIFQIGFQTRANQLFNSPTQTGIVICFCFVDSIVYVNIAIIVNGKLIRNRRKNMLGYLQSWLFITDCLVLIVLLARLGLSIANNKQYFLAISFLDLIICLKFFNIRKYDQILKFYYFDDWSLLLYEFTKHVILLALLCHIVGCVYFLIDVLLIQSMWYPIQNHWLISAQAMPLLYYAPLWQQYLYSFYFSIVTLSTLAYGDITPLNPTQVAFVLIILAFLLMFYVYIFTQIYEVVSWFNRKLIRVKQQRHKITQFLKNFNIPDHLRGRIISQFEFRQSEGEELSKDTFINDISTKLAKSFSSMPYKYDIEKFIPRFIISSGIQNEFFNGALSQKFYTPEEYFSPIQHEKSQSQRWMYFILSKKVYRTITSGTSKLTEIAEKDRWLGINAFIAAQFDINELWHVEIPTQLTALCFTSFRGFLKATQANYQKYMQHCHLVLQTGGTSEDMNKCLICWKQCHSSIYCREYRPQLKRSGGILRKTSRIAQICRLIKESQVTKRTHLKRLYKQSRKILNKCAPKMKGKDKCVEINSKISSRLICLREKNYGMFEVVQEWPNYMAKHNIQYYKKSQQNELQII